MDAIIIACATRNHVNYLSNESASKHARIARYDLQRMLCDKSKTDGGGNYKWIIQKPWTTFTQDVYRTLLDIIVSFKQNLRVINKMTNYYQSYDDGKKVFKKQKKGDSWAIRKSMNKDTVFGQVNLRKIKEVRLSVALESPEKIVDKKIKEKVLQLFAYQYDKKKIEKYFKENASLWKEVNLAKIPVYYFTDESSELLVAVRKNLDTGFTEKKIRESVTDTGIQKILLNHLSNKGDKPELAFSPDGIDEMNRSLVILNGGKPHQPIYKVRVCEPLGNKFKVGTNGNKAAKYVEAAKGTNLFFAIYETDAGKRTYETIPLNVVIEREKMGWLPVPEKNNKGEKLLFWLSPNDLVYLPTEEELMSRILSDKLDRSRIYKIVSFTGNRLYAIPYNVSNMIWDKNEYTQLNKVESTDMKESIKEICMPINVDRLGHITEIIIK